jgi:hypothetical protein
MFRSILSTPRVVDNSSPHDQYDPFGECQAQSGMVDIAAKKVRSNDGLAQFTSRPFDLYRGDHMRTLSWFLKFVVFPLVPFFLGFIVRSLYGGCFAFDSLNPAELGFSMAFLTLVISVNVSRLENQILRDALTQTFHLGAITFLAFFSWSVLLQIDVDASNMARLKAVQEKVAAKAPLQITDFSSQPIRSQIILDYLRMITVGLSVIVIPLALYTSRKYDLDKL